MELLAGALFLPAYKKKVSMKDQEYNEIAEGLRDCLPYDMTPFRFPHTEDLKDGR